MNTLRGKNTPERRWQASDLLEQSASAKVCAVKPVYQLVFQIVFSQQRPASAQKTVHDGCTARPEWVPRCTEYAWPAMRLGKSRVRQVQQNGIWFELGKRQGLFTNRLL